MKKHIPNMLTCCNLLAGAMATVFALHFLFRLALLCIIIGAVFDFFDGMVARLLGVSSPIGKELDSLADDITFGLAPSAMIFVALQHLAMPAPLASLQPWISYSAFIMAAFSALRLAKFNLDTRQSTSFIGVPTPANALFWGSLLVAWGPQMHTCQWAGLAVLIGMLVASFLLVAELPLFALKFKSLSWQANRIKYIFLLGCVPCFWLGWGCLAAMIVWYIFLNVINLLCSKK